VSRWVGANRLPFIVAGVIMAGVALLSRMGEAGDSVRDRWTATARARAWVFAGVSTTRPSTVPVSVDRLVVRVAGVERTVYTMTDADIQLGDPIVSRDGTRVAFVKVEGTSRTARDFLYTIDVDGSGLRRIMELDHTGIPTRGAKIGSCHCAWSHDNRSIVMWGTPKGDRREAVPLDSIAPRLLFTVEVATGRIQRLHTLGGRRPGRGIWGSVVTAQAWAPDSRRFAYMDDTGHTKILDTVTSEEDDLGIGTEPTWSADGEVIAAKLPHEPGTDHGKRNEGDYVGINVRSRVRTRLLENPRSAWMTIGLPEWRAVGYFGPALWSPDGQFLIVQYHGRGEEPQRYVVDRKSGETADVSREFIGASLGGMR
jgi:hypothetical protein